VASSVGEGDCEVAIIGGGPAGLSAALVLGRCRRRVVLYDSGVYRNRAAHAVHAFLTREGIAPEDLRRLGRDEIARYDTVEIRDVSVDRVSRDGAAFVLEAADGSRVRCKKLLLATGIRDNLPEVAGAEELYGSCLFHCVYCDGYELRDQALAAYAHDDRFVRVLTQWSKDVVLCTGGAGAFDAAARARLEREGIVVDSREVVRFEREGEGVKLVFAEGPALSRRAVFFHLGCAMRSNFARELGCDLDEKGGIAVDKYEATCVPGLYVAGDASRDI
jgi:thioredoxin reductase